MSHNRRRTQVYPGPQGSYVDFGTSGTRAGVAGISICDDWVLEGDGHDFEIVRSAVKGGILNVTADGNNRYTDMNNFQCDAYIAYQHDYISLPDYPDMPSNAALATEVKSRTNPSRATVSLPAFLGELKDIPDLVRRAGETALSKVGSQIIQYKFAVAPFVSDIMKMLDFQTATDRRVQELKRLHSKGGLRRKIRLWSGSKVIENANTGLQNWRYSVPTTRKTIVTSYIDGWAKWLPATPDIVTDADLQRQAIYAIRGMSPKSGLLNTGNIADAWQLVPWSWFVDWFGNVGDYLETFRNTVDANCVDILIMTTHEYEVVDTVQKHLLQSGVNCSDGTLYGIRKIRTRATPGLAAQMPFLSAGHLSILSSLAAMKWRK